MTRYPPGLASALKKIAADTTPMRVTNNATAHLWLSPPSRTPGTKVPAVGAAVLHASPRSPSGSGSSRRCDAISRSGCEDRRPRVASAGLQTPPRLPPTQEVPPPWLCHSAWKVPRHPRRPRRSLVGGGVFVYTKLTGKVRRPFRRRQRADRRRPGVPDECPLTGLQWPGPEPPGAGREDRERARLAAAGRPRVRRHRLRAARRGGITRFIAVFQCQDADRAWGRCGASGWRTPTS